MLNYENMHLAQERVTDALYEHDARLAIVPMGGGKTASALTAGIELIASTPIERMLVIGPKRVAQRVWHEEAREWGHLQRVEVAVAVGAPDKRFAAFASHAPVVCTNFENLAWLFDNIEELLVGTRWVVVIDEVSRMQAISGVTAKAWKKIRTYNTGTRTKPLPSPVRVVWALTGTPAPNKLESLYGCVYAVVGGKLWGNSFTTWRNKHFYPTDPEGNTWLPIEGMPEKLALDLAKVAVVVEEHELPQRPKPLIIDIDVPLPPATKRAMHELEKHNLLDIPGREEPIMAASAAVVDGKLHQLTQGFLYDADDLTETRETFFFNDEKFKALEDLVEELQGQPLLIAYLFEEDRRRIEARWPHFGFLGGGATDAQEEYAIDGWNNRELQGLVMHPASGGHGLNIQHGGNYACWYGIPYSYELYAQFNKRLDRPGQQRQVTIYRLRMEGTKDIHRTNTVLVKREKQQNKLLSNTAAAIRA